MIVAFLLMTDVAPALFDSVVAVDAMKAGRKHRKIAWRWQRAERRVVRWRWESEMLLPACLPLTDDWDKAPRRYRRELTSWIRA